jgi:hypothetical protein
MVQGEIVNISNFPGNKVPKDFKFPTSTQRTWEYLRHKNMLSILEQASVVTTDHLAVDGVIALFLMTQPKRALPHYELLKDTALAATYLKSTNPAAIQFWYMPIIMQIINHPSNHHANHQPPPPIITQIATMH